MRDFIAVLEGLGVMEVNPSGSNSGNYSGGSDFYQGSPTLPSGDWGLAAAFGDGQQPGDRQQPAPIDGGMTDGWETDSPYRDGNDEYAGYLAGFARGTGFTAVEMNPSGSGGANQSGGSDFFPGSPTLPSGGWGLSSGERVIGGYSVEAVDASTLNPSGSNSGNYSGGSDFFPGSPTLPSGDWGLAAKLRVRSALDGAMSAGAPPQVAVAAARKAAAQVSPSLSPNRQAFEAAYRAARHAGYDTLWSKAAADRVAARVMMLGWGRYATKR